jgi:hypothetical protein
MSVVGVGGVSDADFVQYRSALQTRRGIGVGDPSHRFFFGRQFRFDSARKKSPLTRKRINGRFGIPI